MVNLIAYRNTLFDDVFIDTSTLYYANGLLMHAFPINTEVKIHTYALCFFGFSHLIPSRTIFLLQTGYKLQRCPSAEWGNYRHTVIKTQRVVQQPTSQGRQHFVVLIVAVFQTICLTRVLKEGAIHQAKSSPTAKEATVFTRRVNRSSCVAEMIKTQVLKLLLFRSSTFLDLTCSNHYSESGLFIQQDQDFRI
ncbi:hypothetical protein L2E82_28143 [Cichorium intybus]|uniref:Uncharacterized protein n=1 Tax=Cichorium intybus TaxID=13427 RepID=A0ACB9CV00_CICIN|nr:hypothetical protein L2E82_28143 [Cichorium intybus]